MQRQHRVQQALLTEHCELTCDAARAPGPGSMTQQAVMAMGTAACSTAASDTVSGSPGSLQEWTMIC
jgi:hypothetical protein